MKELFGVVAVAACVLIGGAEQASAQSGPFCITFPPAYCDQVELMVDDPVGVGFTAGVWDWTCDGVNLSTVAGSRPGINFGTRPVSFGEPADFTAHFTFDLLERSAYLFVLFDPPLGGVVEHIPYLVTEGACDFSMIERSDSEVSILSRLGK